MTNVGVLTIKIDARYVFFNKNTQLRYEKKEYTSVKNRKKFVENYFYHLLFRVRKRRSKSVLLGGFSLLKSFLLWVPQCICTGSYKPCSKKISVLWPVAP